MSIRYSFYSRFAKEPMAIVFKEQMAFIVCYIKILSAKQFLSTILGWALTPVVKKALASALVLF